MRDFYEINPQKGKFSQHIVNILLITFVNGEFHPISLKYIYLSGLCWRTLFLEKDDEGNQTISSHFLYNFIKIV